MTGNDLLPISEETIPQNTNVSPLWTQTVKHLHNIIECKSVLSTTTARALASRQTHAIITSCFQSPMQTLWTVFNHKNRIWVLSLGRDHTETSCMWLRAVKKTCALNPAKQVSPAWFVKEPTRLKVYIIIVLWMFYTLHIWEVECNHVQFTAQLLFCGTCSSFVITVNKKQQTSCRSTFFHSVV